MADAPTAAPAPTVSTTPKTAAPTTALPPPLAAPTEPLPDKKTISPALSTPVKDPEPVLVNSLPPPATASAAPAELPPPEKKRTFTLPTGESIVVVPAPTTPAVPPTGLPPSLPSSTEEKVKQITVVEAAPSSPAGGPSVTSEKKIERVPTIVLQQTKSAQPAVEKEEVKIVQVSPKTTSVTTPVKTMPNVKEVDNAPIPALMPAKTMPVPTKSVEPFAPASAVLIPVTKEAPPPVVVVPADSSKKETASTVVIVPVEAAEAAPPPVMIVPVTSVTESTKSGVVEMPVHVVEMPAAAPVQPVMQVVEAKPDKINASEQAIRTAESKKTIEPVLVPVRTSAPITTTQTITTPSHATVVPHEIRGVGALQPLKRKIAIVPNYIAQFSTILHFSDKFHHELVDAAGHTIFHLHHRHHLIDEHNHLVACVHKSLWCGR